MFAILKMLLSFLNLVQYIFTCVFKFSYFFIRDKLSSCQAVLYNWESKRDS